MLPVIDQRFAYYESITISSGSDINYDFPRNLHSIIMLFQIPFVEYNTIPIDHHLLFLGEFLGEPSISTTVSVFNELADEARRTIAFTSFLGENKRFFFPGDEDEEADNLMSSTTVVIDNVWDASCSLQKLFVGVSFGAPEEMELCDPEDSLDNVVSIFVLPTTVGSAGASFSTLVHAATATSELLSISDEFVVCCSCSCRSFSPFEFNSFGDVKLGIFVPKLPASKE